MENYLVYKVTNDQLTFNRSEKTWSEEQLKEMLKRYPNTKEIDMYNVLGIQNTNLLIILAMNCEINKLTLELKAHDFFKPASMALNELKLFSNSKVLYCDPAFEILRSNSFVKTLHMNGLFVSEFASIAIQKLPLKMLTLENITISQETSEKFMPSIKSNITNLKLVADDPSQFNSTYHHMIVKFVNNISYNMTQNLKYLSISLRDYSEIDIINFDWPPELEYIYIYFTLEHNLKELDVFREHIWILQNKTVFLIEFIKSDSDLSLRKSIEIAEASDKYKQEFHSSTENPNITYLPLKDQNFDLVKYFAENHRANFA